MASTPPMLLALGALLAAYLIHAFAFKRKSAYPLPPGPKGLPILGNINDLPPPGELECHHWAKHKELYGPLSSVTVLGNTFIILNDPSAALELLGKRSEIYSARPFLYFSSKMIGWTRALGMCSYTDRFRALRKSIVRIAGSNASLVNVFNSTQEEESVHFLLNVLQSPEKLFDHIRKEAGAVILKITYGYTVQPHGNDPLVDLAGQTMEEFADASVPGRYVVDIMPWLDHLPDWFPGAGFKRAAKIMSARLNQTTEQPYQFVKQEMRLKKNKPSFLSQALQADPANEEIHKWSASSLYLGGADTTVSSLMTFFLAMMLYPDVQRKAQEELDRVLGGERLPLSADRDNLPYINALVTETHRWHPVAPMAIPHSASREDVFMGYRIPKDAILLPNTWLFTHDPAVYPEPMEFRPERFLGPTPEPDPRQWTFGYGRRVCPGRYVADNALLITVAQVLSVFRITKPVDEDGNVVEPEIKFEPGVVSHPVPYKADIRPRSSDHERLIREAEKEWPWEESDREKLLSVKW